MTASRLPVLLVDDDPVFARYARQLVESLGDELPCALEWVDTAEKALAELGRNSYELVLLDYNLPDGDGLQVLGRIRELPIVRQPGVVMLTARGNEALAVEAMKRGAKDYLPKGSLDLSQLARAIRSALAQKRLTAEVARYDAQMKADLAMARSLQLSLLPERYPNFPRSSSPEQSALRFCHRFCPATELAGDFFSLLALSDTQAGVFICDVMGHGVRSALVTAIVRALVDDLGPRVAEPGQFLHEMNQKLAGTLKQTDGPLYATAFYLIADVATRQLRYANAGHPAPLHIRRGAGLTAPLKVTPGMGPALGLFADARYPTFQTSLAVGDMVLLFTDGLFEVTTPDGQEDYGQERLLAAANQRMALPAAALLDELIAGVRAFAGGEELPDDLCLVSMEVAL